MLCRLCFQKDKEYLQLFGSEGLLLGAPKILRRHFNFRFRADDTISTSICTTCWQAVDSFHQFYLCIEKAQRKYMLSQMNNSNHIAEKKAAEAEQELHEFNELPYAEQEEINEYQEEINDEELTEQHEASTQNIKPSRSIAKRPKERKPCNVLISAQEADECIAKYMPLKCYICHEKQPNFSHLRAHMQGLHQSQCFVTCCNKKFFRRISLADHIKSHLDPDRLKCQECNKIFADRKTLQSHRLLLHQPEHLKIFACQKCPAKFAKSYLLQTHSIKHMEATFMCAYCSKGFPKNYLRLQHERNVHENSNSNTGTICEICGKNIRGGQLYVKKHMLAHAGQNLPKVQCNDCGGWLANKYILRAHKLDHALKQAGAKFYCDLCQKECGSYRGLYSHKRNVHATTRPFKCNICSNTYKKSSNLKQHMGIHTGEVRNQCPVCSRAFNFNSNMLKHYKKKHPNEWRQRQAIRQRNAANPQPCEQTINQTTPSTSATAELSTLPTATQLTEQIIEPLDQMFTISTNLETVNSEETAETQFFESSNNITYDDYVLLE